jgi:hypothetical protein
MATDRVEFGVEAATADGPDLVVTGRCHAGPIRPGTMFARAFRYLHTQVGGEFVRSLEVDERPIRLVVRTIEFYGQFVSELDTGLTGRLRLAGDVLPDLRQDDVLAGPATAE